VDGEAKLIGFVSESEITLDVQMNRAVDRPRTVADVMLPYALTLPESASVTQAAAVLAFEGQQRLAVVSPAGAVIGVLSASDILYWLARSDGHLLPRPRPR
jgi:CBS-domain-containing membrane protein